ncbi:hypothetical protein BVC80_1601g89 [Macleaya cordata]|uniref:Retrotransposon gag domain-containing protein n=1 Tax=Macleaya cordata TaxID=56857 RepID=A0A200QA26_MACCD|nr:hypothetical protein BVC80_1601g89 [Macleaya cordata]
MDPSRREGNQSIQEPQERVAPDMPSINLNNTPAVSTQSTTAPGNFLAEMSKTQSELLTFMKLLTDRLVPPILPSGQDAPEPRGTATFIPPLEARGASTSSDVDRPLSPAINLQPTQPAPNALEYGHSKPTGEYVTVAELQRLLNSRGKESTSDFLFDHRPPYPTELQRRPFPKGYSSPTFILYDGKGNAREHVSWFLEALGEHEGDLDLRLRKFSKSLTGKAYTWYNNLAPDSINTWNEMVTVFYKEFFFVSEQLTLSDLGRLSQEKSEHLNEFVRRFHNQAMDCHEHVTETHLVELCINGMSPMYRALLENLRLQTFSELHEAAKRTTTSVPAFFDRPKTFKQDEKSLGDRRFGPHQNNIGEKRQGPHQAAAANQSGNKRRNQGVRQPNQPLKWPTKEPGQEPPDFPCSFEDVLGLLDAWIQDAVIWLPPIRRDPTQQEMNDPKYCRFHRTVGHPTKECRALKWVFSEKIQTGELDIGEARQGAVNNNPLPDHHHHVRTLTHVTDSIEEETFQFSRKERDVVVIEGGSLITEDQSQEVIKMLFEQFFDKLGFNVNQSFDAVLAITAISMGQPPHYGEICIVDVDPSPDKVHRDITFTDDDMTASKDHLRPLYILGRINGVEFKRAFVDTGASLNVITLRILDVAGVPHQKITRLPTKVHDFGASQYPFEPEEKHMVDATFFDEACAPGEGTPRKIYSTPLLVWEDTFAPQSSITSTNVGSAPPCNSNHQGEPFTSNKRRRFKICLKDNGRVIYYL